MTKHNDEFDCALVRIVREARRIFPEDPDVLHAAKLLEDAHVRFRRARHIEYRVGHEALEVCRSAEEVLQDIVRLKVARTIA